MREIMTNVTRRFWYILEKDFSILRKVREELEKIDELCFFECMHYSFGALDKQYSHYSFTIFMSFKEIDCLAPYLTGNTPSIGSNRIYSYEEQKDHVSMQLFAYSINNDDEDYDSIIISNIIKQVCNEKNNPSRDFLPLEIKVQEL